MPWQLTVGQLRAALADVADDVVVALALSPSAPRDDRLTLILNVHVDYHGGPVLTLSPVAPRGSSE